MNDLDQRTNRAFWLAVAGVLTCCGPLGVVALVLAVLVKRDCEMNRVETPPRVMIAIVLGVISCIELGAGYYLAAQKQKEHAAALKTVSGRLATKRTEAKLEQSTACDLVTESLMSDSSHTYDSARCPLPLELVGEGARLPGVVAVSGTSETSLDYCIAHGERWFVLGTPTGATCPAAYTAVAGNEADEAKARAAFVAKEEADAVAKVHDQLIKVRDVVKAREHVATACPASEAKGQISYVDLELLDAKSEPEVGWAFLTKSDVRNALAKDANPHDAAAVLSAPGLVVFSSDERRLPTSQKDKGFISDSFTFTSGGLHGWMTLVDPRDAKVLCEAPFFFRSSKTIKYRKGHVVSEESKVADALQDDLEDNFKDAAADTIKSMTGSRLKLGVKLLE